MDVCMYILLLRPSLLDTQSCDRSYYKAISQIFSNALHHCLILWLPLISSFIHKTKSRICCRTSTAPRIPMVRSIFQSNSAWTALILLCCLFFSHPFCKASGSQCYTNKGAPVDVDFPCHPTLSESFCCGAGWACLPNRLCSSPASDGMGLKFARGSCTDRLWASTSPCPNFCLDTTS